MRAEDTHNGALAAIVAKAGVAVTQYDFIDGTRQLEDALTGLEGAGQLAVDTEFFRERTYFARLCLVQLAAGDRVMLVDPLAIEDLGPLVARLRSPAITKILHAARQDIEVMLPLTVGPPAPVFDTQIAASLLGHAAQIGYAPLVSELLGVDLAKGHARADWAARPLLPAQLAYAADDVRYLEPLASILRERLAAAGRLGWLEEECAALLDPALHRNLPEDAWQRLRGLERMTSAERAVVRALAAWRETRAMSRDLPRSWVMPDETIRELARRRPDSPTALAAVPGLSAALARHSADELIERVATAAREEVPADEPPDRLTPEQKASMRRLQTTLQAVAAHLGLVPEVLATRRDLTALARGSRDAVPLRGWRREVVGEALLTAL